MKNANPHPVIVATEAPKGSQGTANRQTRTSLRPVKTNEPAVMMCLARVIRRRERTEPRTDEPGQMNHAKRNYNRTEG